MVIIEKLYDKIFRSDGPDEEWLVWHRKTKYKISMARVELKVFELSDPTEVKYYGWIADEILNCIRFINGPILEVGGGSGALSLELNKRCGHDVAILDSSEVALEYARIVFGDRECMLARGDAVNVPFATESFGLVHSIGLIEHFSDNVINDMIKEMSRLTKKGGYVFVAVPNYFSPDLIGLWRKYGKGSERYMSTKKLAEFAKIAKLSVIRVGHSEFSFSDNLGRFIPQSVEKVLGRCGMGFLNYIVCKK